MADPALAAQLLGVNEAALLHYSPVQVSSDDQPVSSVTLRDGSLLGRLFESLVTLNIRIYA